MDCRGLSTDSLGKRNGSLVDRGTVHGWARFGRIPLCVTLGTPSSDSLIGSDWHIQERQHFLLGVGEIGGKDKGVIAHLDFVSLNISKRLSQNLDRRTDSGRIGVESRRFVTAFKEPGNVEHGW